MSYAFDNAWHEARRRLAFLEHSLDPATFRRIKSLGLAEGWRCLEAGAGGGSVAQWLCANVGITGRVLATDIDTRFLDGIQYPNLEVKQLDLRTDSFPENTFDLVHTRMVLMHIPSRAEILPRLVSAVKPEGWLLVEEQDIYPVVATTSGPYRDVWNAFSESMVARGVAREWARELPQLLDTLGLHEVQAEATVSMFPGASPMAEFWSLTWKQVRDQIEATLGDGEVLDRTLSMLADPNTWFTGPALVAAWARR